MKESTSLNHLIEASLKYEKPRVASEVRRTHLVLNGLKRLVEEGKISAQESENLAEMWEKKGIIPECYDTYCRDAETDKLWEKECELEKYADSRVAALIKSHPAYPWFSRVKGIGGENIGKAIYAIDIEKADTISALWRFAGFAAIDGHAEHRTEGEKMHYSNETRSMFWRLSKSLIRAGGKFYEYYVKEKANLQERCRRNGIKVLPTPSGKWLCTNCGKSSAKKVEMALCCNNQHLVKNVREEPEGVMWLGHLDAQASRKMIKAFIACLYIVWRGNVNLPIREPYAMEYLGHTTKYMPEDFVDRNEKEVKRRTT